MHKDVDILVIKGEEKATGLIESTVRSAGYNVWLANDHNEGLKLLRSNTFPIVITEVLSVKMDVAHFCREVNKLSPLTNVIVVALYSLINNAIKAMEAGAYGYITKPLNVSEIRIVVERAVERYFLFSAREDKDYFVDLAVRDGLTGLFNRRYFNELIKIEFSRIKRLPSFLSLLILDIDNFKNYNDTQGHSAGDILLKNAAKIFKSSVRTVDIVFRYGGEEFAVILPSTDKKGAQIIAERIRMQVSLYLPTTVSIGISTAPEDAEEISLLIEKADKALYQAKNSGKNKWCVA
jgi:two-component system, cell cycle response regulator